jgi:hypothetical protein
MPLGVPSFAARAAAFPLKSSCDRYQDRCNCRVKNWQAVSFCYVRSAASGQSLLQPAFRQIGRQYRPRDQDLPGNSPVDPSRAPERRRGRRANRMEAAAEPLADKADMNGLVSHDTGNKPIAARRLAATRYATMDHGSGTRRYWPAVSTRWAKPGMCKWPPVTSSRSFAT